MATTVTPPIQEPSQGEAAGSARTSLVPRVSQRRQVVRLVILAVAIAVLVDGWVVADTNLSKLPNPANAVPILGALLKPDVVARDVAPVELVVPVIVGAGSSSPATTTGQNGQTFRVNPGSPVPGRAVALDGAGFAPNADGQIRLQNPTRKMDSLWLPVHTDDKGGFHGDAQWPDYSTLPPDIYQLRLIIDAPTGQTHLSDTLAQSITRVGETILLALTGTFFGVLLAVPLSFLGSRNLMGGSAIGRGVSSVVRGMFTIARSIEVLILGVVVVVIVGIGSYALVLALVVHTVGSLGELYSEAIDSIELGPVEASRATGANSLQTVLFGVMPRIAPVFLATTIYWWDHNVRVSTVLGLVGAGGIGFLLVQYLSQQQYNQAATVLWMIVLVVTAMDFASAAIRSRLV